MTWTLGIDTSHHVAAGLARDGEPVASARATSRAMITDSATGGQLGSPSRPDISPSWQQASAPARGESWACWASTPSKGRTHSKARLIRLASMTQRPSSENTETRARERCISPSSASSRPASSSVMAPTGITWQWLAATPSVSTCSAVSAVSVTGWVLAIAKTAVNPPRAAARDPDSTVSASSRPGSRRWVCRSTSPGSANSPSASITVDPMGWSFANRPDSMKRSVLDPSGRVTPVMASFDMWLLPPVSRPADGAAHSYGPRPPRRPGRARWTADRRRLPS